MQRIVTIGGGTGHFQILRGLKNYDVDITAIVNMADDGGSTGILRDELGVLPPGDLRQCIVALADGPDSHLLRELFNYRFEKGHNLGNLIMTALTDITGSPIEGIRAACKLMGIKGKVIPVTTDDIQLHAETDKGEILRGETKVSYPPKGVRIKRLFHDPKGFLHQEAGAAIRAADKIIICPGDLHGSICSNFLVNSMVEALQQSKAQKIYICNLVTKLGSVDFTASDFVNEIEKYAQIKLDKILINSGTPSEELVTKYLDENSHLVVDDLGNDSRVVRGDFIGEFSKEPKTFLRHVPEKVAKAVMEI